MRISQLGRQMGGMPSTCQQSIIKLRSYSETETQRRDAGEEGGLQR